MQQGQKLLHLTNACNVPRDLGLLIGKLLVCQENHYKLIAWFCRNGRYSNHRFVISFSSGGQEDFIQRKNLDSSGILKSLSIYYAEDYFLSATVVKIEQVFQDFTSAGGEGVERGLFWFSCICHPKEHSATSPPPCESHFSVSSFNKSKFDPKSKRHCFFLSRCQSRHIFSNEQTFENEYFLGPSKESSTQERKTKVEIVKEEDLKTELKQVVYCCLAKLNILNQ